MASFKTLVCLFVLAVAAFGQTDRGSITGAISDPAGAVVPNAVIEVKNADTGAVYQGGTSATGNYVIAVPVGRYSLSVTVAGFKKYVRENLLVTVATAVRQDVTLEVGANTETVTVTAEAPLLKTESGELSHNVTVADANNLPVLTLGGGQSFFSNGFGNIRDPLAVSQLIPGVTYGTDAGLSVNGLPASTEAIRIEGQDATNGMWNQITQINQSGVDAIQEVSIQTSNFAAEFGQAAGGYFNYTMKSGTNQFHGSGYEYFVNEAFNAGLPFTNAGTTNALKNGQQIRNRLRRNDFGGTIGGPVDIPKVYNGHDKTFFFFNFERFVETRSFTNLETVPTAAFRSGDFTTTGLFPISDANFVPLTDALGRLMFVDQVYDPKSTRQVGGVTVRDPFTGPIPKTQLDPVALAIQNFIPLPTNTSNAVKLSNFALPTYNDFQHTTNWSVKLDHSLSPTIKISGYFSRILTFNPNSNGIAGPISQASATDNKSNTVRINYDQTLKPTLLLHLGVGYLYTYVPSDTEHFDQTSLGLKGYPNPTYFPNLTGLSDFFNGGVNLSSGPFGGGVAGPNGFLQNIWDQKPTANANLTWVKNNHTYKFGGEMIIEGFPDKGNNRANGNFGFAASSTGNPQENVLGAQAPITTGFGYASFLLGQVDNLNINPPTQSKLGDHSLGFYAQDTWKVTRKLTLDYGLRYDYQTYLKEQYGRMPDTVFNVPNPGVGGRLGATLFEGYGGGRCNCQFSHSYPFAFGPRVGFAYQVDTKTVFRGGAGIQYSSQPNNAFLSYNDTVFYAVSGPGYGLPFMNNLTSGNPFAPGNANGLAPLVYPNFDPAVFPVKTGGGLPPDSPFINIDRDSRPGRVITWSVGLQRELQRNLVVEVSYVGNRGVWFTAPELNATDYNPNTPQSLLQNWKIDIHNPADQALLLTPISSPLVTARFPFLANPDNVYKGFPSNQVLSQALRPAPQFLGVPPFLGPPLGKSWYDALQVQATKRYSHGLSAQGSFTWSKNEVLGTSAATQYFTPGTPLINDVFNYGQNKQLAQNGAPLALVISGTYVTPKINGDGTSMKLLSQVLRDWQIGTLLRYQSGALVQTPPSNNNLLSQMRIGPENNPALWGGGHTFWNTVQGQPEFLVDPNSHFDPTKQLVLNPAAWTDAPAGQFGAAAPFYNGNRWQRKPAESLNFGRNFRMGKEGRYNLQVRAEFQNVFNRLFYSAPAVGSFGNTNPASQTQNANLYPNGASGALSAGYGFVNFVNGAGATPRSGQMVARFTF
ncbi:MAG: TonB-dependent receptor [Acidobacteriia bacterium]|nr:TonB-dependent receptor [Terriglobia bacterium]